MKIISKYTKLGNHKIFLKLFFSFVFCFHSRECLSSLSGDSIVLLNSHGVQGKKMSHTKCECIHKVFLSTYINKGCFLSFFFFYPYRCVSRQHSDFYIHFFLVYIYTYIYTFTHRWKKKLPLFGLQGSVMKSSSHFKGLLVSFLKKYSRKIRN